MDSARYRLVHVSRLPAEIDDGHHERGEKDVNGLHPVLAIVEEKHPKPIRLATTEKLRRNTEKVSFKFTRLLIGFADKIAVTYFWCSLLPAVGSSMSG